MHTQRGRGGSLPFNCHVVRARSYLGEKIMLDWCDGILWTTGLVSYARAAQRDGLNLPMLNRIAQLGGLSGANCAKDMKTLLGQAGVSENITPLSGPLYKHCILPSTMIKLIARSPNQFKMRLAPSRAAVELFWQELFSSDSGMAYKMLHPHLKNKTTEQLGLRFPCRVHQNAAPYTKNLGADTIDWSSLMAQGTEIETRCQRIFEHMFLKCFMVRIEPSTHPNLPRKPKRSVQLQNVFICNCV